MSRQDNPFVTIAATMRQQAEAVQPVGMSFGTVVSPSPLRISVRGLEVTAEALEKNSALPILYAGDRCLMLPLEEAQRWVIICKVVGA